MVLLEKMKGKYIQTSHENKHNYLTEQVVFKTNRYEAFLRRMNTAWRLEIARGIIQETDTDFIHTFRLRKGQAGRILELHCPPSKAVSMFGKNQMAECTKENGVQYSYVRSPYALTVRCYDDRDMEPDGLARLNIKLIPKPGEISSAWRVSYGDISSVDKKYQFPYGVCLSSNEVIAIEAVNIDIDIERIEVSMEADVFCDKQI